MISRFIHIWTEEHEIGISSGGALTVSREDLQRGCEPDKCYFIQQMREVLDHDEYSLDDHDPPPDLVVEVDVTASSIPRMPIYKAIGVPEVWRWRNEQFHVFTLAEDGRYAPRNESSALPGFPFHEALRLLQLRRELNETTLAREFREFIRRASLPDHGE